MPIETHDKWHTYAGLNGQTHIIDLRDVIGVKFPDELTGGVTLRLSNGHFVSLDKSVLLSQVQQDLGISC